MGTCSSPFQAEKVALKEVIQWLTSISSWASPLIICDCLSLVQAISKPNSVDSTVIQLKAAAAVLAMSKSTLIMWAPALCGLPGNNLADQKAKQSATDTQPDNALHAVHWRALIRRSSRPTPIQHERLKEYTSRPDEQTKTSFSKMQRTD